MATDGEPFGDCLYDGITDLHHHIRKTIGAAIQGVEVRARRAAVAAQPIKYHGGPVHWEAPQLAEAA